MNPIISDSMSEKRGLEEPVAGTAGRKVVVRIVGGLGNQMFQYAAARAVADRIGAELELDLRPFETYELFDYELSSFRIRANRADHDGLNVAYPKWREFLYTKMPWLPRRGNWYVENGIEFDPALNEIDSVEYLSGYFQSEKYFVSNRDNLLRDFTLNEELSGDNLSVANNAATTNSVAIHIRRGDYVDNKKTNQIHGVCTPTYYQEAMRRLSSDVENLVFFLFSNDHQWALDNLQFPGELVVVKGNMEKPEIDMVLMSNCRHHIIANSSFSWWGAWLCQHPGKSVTAPQPWFQSKKMNSMDIVPKDWRKIAIV